MYKARRIIAFILFILCILPLLCACTPLGKTEETGNGTTDQTTSPNDTDNVDIGEQVEVSPDGAVEWTLLGVRNCKTFAGVSADDGNTLVVVYLEARNKSTSDVYISSINLETDPEPIVLSDEALPESYSNFGGMIASGKRKLFCLCFEEKPDWYKVIVEYKPYSGKGMSNILFGKNYTEETEMLQGNPAYPIDTDGNEAVIADFDILFDRYYTSQWGTPNEASALQYEAMLQKANNGSYFTSVDYSSNSASAWDTVNHLIYLKNLLVCYGEERLKTDTDARNTAISVLDYWLNNDFDCTVNWWYNEIQTPRYMASIGLMLNPYLSDQQKAKMDEIIGRGTLRGSSKATTYTGANLSDMMATTIVHGLFIGDADLIFAAVDRMSAEVIITSKGKEGMQEDGSYFQHGTLLCSAGSYGAIFVQGMRTFITQLHGTCFSLPDKKIKLFIDHILDGQRYFHRAYGTSYFSIGRSAVYANGSSELYLTAAALAKLDGIYRGDELKQYAESFADHTKSIDAYRYFPLSYSLVRTSPAYYMSVRGAHQGFILTEVVNRQNLLGYNLSYGANTCYMYYGDEYQAIGAVLDFSMFPGITTYHEDDATLLARYNTSYNKTWGKSTYIGTHCDGVTDEEKGLGAMYMELQNDGITGKLSFITYNGGMIVLGAGLNCNKTSNLTEIRTSLNQCKLDNARIGSTALVLDSGDVTVTGDGAIYNGAFAYYNLGEGTLTATAKRMSGSYSRTDSAKPESIQSADVFQLYISHGTALQNASYAYAVVGNADGKAPSSASELPVSKITNTENIQALEFTDGHAVIIFHSAGSYTLSSGETITATEAKIIIH